MGDHHIVIRDIATGELLIETPTGKGKGDAHALLRDLKRGEELSEPENKVRKD
jgi:hypothetical protein